MRALGTIVLLTGGLSAAAYAYMPVASFDEHNLSRLIEIQSPAGRVAVPVAPPDETSAASRTFSPSTPMFARAVSRSAGEGSADAASATTNSQPWRAIVTSENVSRAAQSSGDAYVAQVALAREIQRELKRVGCYSGDADGDWKTASRRSMGAFLDRINASLPTEAPDHIMLTLLQGRSDRVCGTPCGSGQTAGADGQCVPNAILAQVPAAAPRLARGPYKAERPTVEGMATGSLAGVTPPAPTAIRGRVAAAPSRASGAPNDVDLAAAADTVAQPLPTERRSAPLPGRMSIGAAPTVAAPAYPGNRNATDGSSTAPAPPAHVIARETNQGARQDNGDGARRSWGSAAESAREPATSRRVQLRQQAYRGERRPVAAYEVRPRRKKLTVTDLMRQINGF